MTRVSRKYAALFELAALAASETPPEDWASRLLRLMSSAGWADPSFLEELSDSGLVRTMCRALPVLKANAANRATASSVQDLADLEESMRKLRHELALAEKRLPSNGVLGSGGSAFYTTWASVGHVCTLILQALTYGAASGQSPTAPTARASPAPTDAARAGSTAASPAPAGAGATGDAAGTTQPAGLRQAADAQAADPASPAATPIPAADGTAAAAGGSSGTSTPRGGAPVKPPGGGAPLSPGSGSGMPALATEGGLVKLLGNKHVVAHAKQVMRVVPEPYKVTLARILLTQISTEMKATEAGLVHIMQILHGDPAVTSPAPSTLPKSWFTTAAVLTAYSDALRPCISLVSGPASIPSADTAAQLGAAEPAPVDSPSGAAPTSRKGREVDLANGGRNADGASASTAGGAAAASISRTWPADINTEAADVPAGSAAADDREHASRPPGESGASAELGPDRDAAAAGATGTSAPSTPPAGKGAAGAKIDSAVGSPLGTDNAAAHPGVWPVAASATDDPRVALTQLLQGVASALCEAVTGAHGVGRMALLLRGEAAVKFPNVAAYMPAALSINELMGHLDGLACVATALGAPDSIRPSVTSLLTSQAMKDLLGAGKVYVTTVIAAGALTRDLAIDAVIPQTLRQGYMAAVLTPLETGALLNERRAPQVLAYRNSITESSYYQVMDAEALPYGVNVRFEDEQEAEGMGVVREWLSQIAADIFSPGRGLFVRGAADKRVVHPAQHARLQEDYLGYMRFAGRIVGLALRANVPLGVVLSTGLFNYLTGRRATLQDLQQLDPQVHTTCQNILSQPGVEALELFHVWHASGAADAGGGGGETISTASCGGGRQEEEQDLLPGGASLRVTDANKAQYVQLLAHHVVVTVVEKQCAAFLSGVQDTAHHLPDDVRLRRAFLAPLLLEDLNRITAGESNLDPDDWAEHTDVAGFDGPEEHGSLDMFWQLVSEYSQEDRQRLLQFWTAMTHLPSGGFKALNQRLQIMKFGPPVAVRPAGGEAAADGQGAAAAVPRANGHGPSADGAGPRSHRIDGDSLLAEEQEQSDGMDEAAEEAGPQGGEQRQLERTPAAGGSGGALGSPRASEEDRADAGATAATDAAGAAAAQAPSRGSAPHGDDADGIGDDADLPYDGEEEYDEEGAAGEDAMDYGEDDDEADDEEFQRQLEMALALSLQDMSAEEPPPQQPQPQGTESGAAAPGGSGGGAAAEGAGRAGTAGTTGDDGQGSPPGEAAPEAAAGREGESANGHEPAGGHATDTTAAGSEDVAGGPRDAAAGASATTNECGSGHEPASTPSPSLASGANAMDGAAGSAAPAPEPSAGADGGSRGGSTCATAAEDTIRSESEGDAAAGEAGPSEVAEGTDAAGSSEQQEREAGGGAVALEGPGGGSGGVPGADLMGVDGGQGAAVDHIAATGGSGGGGSGEADGGESGHGGVVPPASTSDDTAAGGRAHAQGADAAEGGGARRGLDAERQLELQHAQGSEQRQQGQAVGLQQQQQHDLELRAGELQEPQGGPGQELGAAPMTGVAEDGAGSAAGGGTALAAPQSASRAVPLLPQARTCFLQLNLPVYGTIEDMRRAFEIALDNMSFGLH